MPVRTCHLPSATSARTMAPGTPWRPCERHTKIFTTPVRTARSSHCGAAMHQPWPRPSSVARRALPGFAAPCWPRRPVSPVASHPASFAFAPLDTLAKPHLAVLAVPRSRPHAPALGERMRPSASHHHDDVHHVEISARAAAPRTRSRSRERYSSDDDAVKVIAPCTRNRFTRRSNGSIARVMAACSRPRFFGPCPGVSRLRSDSDQNA